MNCNCVSNWYLFISFRDEIHNWKCMPFFFQRTRSKSVRHDLGHRRYFHDSAETSSQGSVVFWSFVVPKLWCSVARDEDSSSEEGGKLTFNLHLVRVSVQELEECVPVDDSFTIEVVEDDVWLSAISILPDCSSSSIWSTKSESVQSFGTVFHGPFGFSGTSRPPQHPHRSWPVSF